MTRFFSVLSILLAVTATTGAEPPQAKRVPHKTTNHGVERVDNYHWMRDRGQQKDPEILEYLEQENLYTKAQLEPHNSLVDHLYKEIIGRIKQTDSSVPYRLGKHWYYSEEIEGKQYPIYRRASSFEKDDSEVILNQNDLAKGHKFCQVRDLEVSDDGHYLAYLVDFVGYRQYTLQVKDLRTGQLLPNKIERVTTIEWGSDSSHLFVTTEDKTSKRSNRYWRHNLADNETELVYEETDPLFNLYGSRSRDGRLLFLNSEAKTMDEYRTLPADQPLAEPQLVIPRSEGHQHGLSHLDGELYIRTNNQAKGYRIVKAPLADPRQENWVEVVGHRSEVTLNGLSLFKGFAVVSETEGGLDHLSILNLKTGQSRRLETPETLYTISLSGRNYQSDASWVRYNYQSLVTPPSVHEVNLESGETRQLKQTEVLGGYDKGLYETRRVWATARDGVKVPVSLVMKKGTPLDGSAPMLLYAYGSYGYSIPPSFSYRTGSLTDRGVIYAIAHIRGGATLGEQWRLDGRMFKKMNTFTDFIDCANWLIENRYTSAQRLVIRGGSAGGMLMGGVVNMSPQTFKAAIVDVPFLDVVTTMLDETLPLTTEEWIEWGNPNEKPAFDYMMTYSPYDNVRTQDYPNMLVLVSLWDSQVPYWEGAKFVAKVRELKTNPAEVLLKTNTGGGHGGSSGRYDWYKDEAFRLAYALTQMGITK